MDKLIIEVGSRKFSATLCQNSSAKAFKEMLPINLQMDDLHGNEKYHYFSQSLPTNSEQVRSIKTGDLMLFGSNCLVLFYKNFSTTYSYSRIATLDNLNEFTKAVGKKGVQVSFKLKNG